MKGLLFYLIIPTSAAVIPPLVSLNISGLASTAANGPAVGTPDPRFQIEASFEGPKLPLISCLMSAVELLMTLGMQDFSGSMGKAAWNLDSYPQVGMVISPITYGGTIEHRFVIWGISQGAAHMIHLIRFQAVTFTLSWEGEEVGTIELVAWRRTRNINQSPNINSTQSLNKQSSLSMIKHPSSLSVFPKNTNITGENVQDQDLIVRVVLMGLKVPLFDVFLLVITVLVEVASREATERLQNYESPINAAGVGISFRETLPARTTPPFLEVQWLMKTMVLIPKYMIMRGAFEEAMISVVVDGVRVADAYLG